MVTPSAEKAEERVVCRCGEDSAAEECRGEPGSVNPETAVLGGLAELWLRWSESQASDC